ncbi:MAG: hypothetical protein VX874_03225 [Pseudomonadota bacterium]|nr:hypothetical protein [Pseudomonadota bacterium]
MNRVEYRAFGVDPKQSRKALMAELTISGHDSRCDIYLLLAKASSVFKLRDGTALDLKRLVERHHRYEQWEPSGCCCLPATGKDLRVAFGRGSGLPEFDQDRHHDQQAVLHVFGAAGFHAVPVVKHRTRFKQGPCAAELTRVDAAGHPETWTLAIEGPSPDSLHKLSTRIGLSTTANVSYPEWLGSRIHPEPH